MTSRRIGMGTRAFWLGVGNLVLLGAGLSGVAGIKSWAGLVILAGYTLLGGLLIGYQARERWLLAVIVAWPMAPLILPLGVALGAGRLGFRFRERGLPNRTATSLIGAGYGLLAFGIGIAVLTNNLQPAELGDTWILTGQAWSQERPTSSQSARQAATLLTLAVLTQGLTRQDTQVNRASAAGSLWLRKYQAQPALTLE